MKGHGLSRLSYANVVATVALFLALGGSSYAALVVTGRNVKNGSLTTRDIKDRSLLRKDFKSGQLPAGPRGAKGDTGAPGTPGAPGRKGDPGPAAELPPLEPRQTPLMQNGWINVSARYYKDRSGIVHLEGRVVAPSDGARHLDTIFTLPAGYRPANQTLFLYSEGGAAADLFVDPDGQVRPNNPPPPDGGSVRFDAITFRPSE